MATKHKRHVRKRTHKKKGVAKGRTASLRERFSKSNSNSNSNASSVRRLRSQGFRKTKTYRKSSSSSSPNRYEEIAPKEVRINTPENEIYEYYLASSEKDWKLPQKDKSIPICKKKPHKKSHFPCRRKNTVFNSKKDYEEYEFMKDMRNESTNFKSRKTHYDDIDSMLMLQGDELYRIDSSDSDEEDK